MQHQVPQFIEVEDKIFGPLTAKQFFYMVAASSIVFILYIFLQLWLVIIIGTPLAGFFVALAFLKINGVPFVKIMNNALSFYGSKHLFLWKKVPRAVREEEEEVRLPGEVGLPGGPKLSQNKLSDLSWSLDVQPNTKQLRK